MPPDSGVHVARQFAAKARIDLSAAETLARSEGDYADVVCFHCQQAVEKLLKAAILAAGSEPARTHDVSFLAESLAAVRTLPEGLEAICAQLADLGVAPRYPGWDAAALGIDVNEILEATRRAVVLLEPLLALEMLDADAGPQ